MSTYPQCPTCQTSVFLSTVEYEEPATYVVDHRIGWTRTTPSHAVYMCHKCSRDSIIQNDLPPGWEPLPEWTRDDLLGAGLRSFRTRDGTRWEVGEDGTMRGRF